MAQRTLNPNRDGGHCASATGQVRVYPIGAGGNLILCRACFDHENAYNRERERQERRPRGHWPSVEWERAKVYPDA